MSKDRLIYSAVLVSVMLIFNACGTDSTSDENEGESIESEVMNSIDTNVTQIYKFDNTLFSIPSPYEISILMKNLNIEYNPNIINSVGNAQTYTNNFQKALNLGVYGADLAYLNMNKQIPEAAKYFATIKITAEELQLSGAFDVNTITRIENNLSNEDSLLHILSMVYRNTDKYLKENNRQDIGVLVLTGGWIESVYFLAQVAQETNNDEIKTRLGEQKYPLENLIKILSPFYNNSEQYGELIEALIDLAYVFDGIDIEYTYEKPVTDEEAKETIINSSSNLLMNAEHIDMITKKISKIRTDITD